MVEPQPSKLMTRVRFPLPAPVWNAVEDAVVKFRPCGSEVEHSLGKGEVGSSILPMGTSLMFFVILNFGVIDHGKRKV